MNSIRRWVANNPFKAMLLGIGVTKQASQLGIRSLYAHDEDGVKRACQALRGLPKRDFLKIASQVARENSVRIICNHLSKAASARDCVPAIKIAFARIEQDLLNGKNIHTAFKNALPGMPAERRGIFASRVVKAAQESFKKQAMSSCTEKKFTGSPKDGMSWMKQNS